MVAEGEGAIVAYILVRINLGREYELLEQVRRLPGVDEVRIVYGEYDMVVKVRVNALFELDRIVTQLRKLNGVLTTTTLISS
ncbi:MAG: Lrp/AsnC ligand binding domain-containing protein [Sulfolobales archaeon]